MIGIWDVSVISVGVLDEGVAFIHDCIAEDSGQEQCRQARQDNGNSVLTELFGCVSIDPE